MQLQSDALDYEGRFDSRYTCDLDNSSPELRWDDPPEGTRSFAVVAEDLDHRTGPFTHWLIYRIPPQIRHLPAGIPAQESLPNGIRQGLNGFGKLGYTGPCPPYQDRAHHYRVRIFALSEDPEIPARITREALLERLKPLTLAEGELFGEYARIAKKAG
ncbi:MAG: hypothetical protein A2X94_06040 [Bdellovibrionales bacterium GWB1_55_8]|nr:MAG: hypothetical protein A2X94_06040 [Bdellovibrionales bacterium GWB1_55_8]